MSRVLILTAGYGEGHNAAAYALAEGVRALGGEADVRDLFLETYGRKQVTSRLLYLQCIDRAPWLWAAVYRAMELPPVAWITMHTLWPLKARLRALIAEQQPTAVVSVYPAYGHLLDQLYGGAAPFAEHTLITDSISVNSIWYTHGPRGYIVANEVTADIVRKRQPSTPVHPLGFPVRTVFADTPRTRPVPGEGTPLRVLLMVNHAKAGAASLVRRLLALPHVCLTVTVGRDAALGRELRAAAGRKALTILGWVKNMPELLMEHHILIGKAGGAATQEALASHTPMLITQIVPGQEEGNAQLILDNECGALTTTTDAVASALQELAHNDFARWKHWAVQCVKLGRPDSARTVARFILTPP